MDKKLLRAQLLIEAAELLNEGAVKTKKQHILDDYLAKYDYKGDKKRGTITVDGHKYIIDRDTKNPVVVDGEGNKTLRQTSAILNSKNTIALDKRFEKLKNNKRRDAVLQHEIGHIKHHRVNGENSTDQHRDAIIDSLSKAFNQNNPIYSKKTI